MICKMNFLNLIAVACVYSVSVAVAQMAKINRLDVEHMEIGEGPHWDDKTQSLYFVDIRGPKLFKYSPQTDKTISISMGTEPVGFIVPVKGQPNCFIIGEKLSLVLVHWDTEKNSLISREVLVTLPEPNTNRINDGKADANGRVWFGTMTDGKDIVPGAGSFYSYTRKEGLRKHRDNVGISNGIANTLDNQTFYFIDSMTYQVEAYDFNIKDGKIGNAKVIFDYKKNGVSGIPDGMTIDTDGNLWVACFGGNKVIQFRPSTGELIRSIIFPKAHQITSVSFGGANFDELYVTSAEENVPATEKEKFPESGSIYRVTGLGAKGLPASDFDLTI